MTSSATTLTLVLAAAAAVFSLIAVILAWQNSKRITSAIQISQMLDDAIISIRQSAEARNTTLRQEITTSSGKLQEAMTGAVRDLGSHLESEAKASSTQLGGAVDAMNERVDTLGGRVGSIGERVDSVGGRVDAIGERVNSIGERVTAVGGGVDSLGERVNTVGDRVKGVGESVGALATQGDQAATQASEHVAKVGDDLRQTLEARLADSAQQHATDIRTIRDEIGALIGDLENSISRTMASIDENHNAISRTLGNVEESHSERMRSLDGSVSSLFEKYDHLQHLAMQTMESQLAAVRSEVGAHLDELRRTFDEGLKSTLETRVHETVSHVGSQLEGVHKQISYHMLGAVGTEFIKYNDVIDHLSRQLSTAAESLGSLGGRIREMNTALRDVEKLPGESSQTLVRTMNGLEGGGEAVLSD